MQKTRLRKSLSFILCIVLIAAMALFTTGCKGDETTKSAGTTAQGIELPVTDGAVLGEGETAFSLQIVDKDGNETNVEIHTDEKTVGEALNATGLIEGEEGQYGFFITAVNGIQAIYEKDGVYWAFYVDGEYAMSGVDQTEIKEGATYALKVEK